MCERIGHKWCYCIVCVYAPTNPTISSTDSPSTFPFPYTQGFKSVLMARLDGSFDATKYEDGCRQLMGNKSYMLYTLDKARGYIER